MSRAASRRGPTYRAPGGRGTSTPSGTSASSRANRCRRAISKETRATSQGRLGTFSGRSMPADLEHEDPVGAQRDGPAERDRVHDAAVEVVLVADLGRRQQPGYGGARHDRVHHPAAVEPVLGRSLDAGRADLEPDRQLLEGGLAELLEPAAAAAARRSRCGCRSTTARRTVRSGRSPTPRPRASPRPATGRSAARSPPSVGSRATMAPLSAPTLVPSTRSGMISRSNSARSMPTSTAPSTPPPPSTNAVVMRPLSTDCRRAADDELGVLARSFGG